MATYWTKDSSIISYFIISCLAIGPLFCWAQATSSKEELLSSDNELNSAKVDQRLVVRPVVRELPTTRHVRSIDHADHAEQLTVSLRELPIVLDLQLNKDLIPHNFYVHHHGIEDVWRSEEFSAQSFPVCHYRGRVRNVSNSWVTLSTCFGLSGAVFDGAHLFYIEPLNNTLDGDHSWIPHSQQLNSSFTFCDEDHHRSSEWQSVKVKRQTSNHVAVHNVELVLVVDYAIYLRNNGDMYKILKRVLDIVNVIKQIYSSLQISVMLVGVIVWSSGDKINIDKDASQTLSKFKEYRHAHLETKVHDNAQLMTGVDGKHFGGPVGRAYVGTLCHTHDSCGIAVDDPNSPAAMTASIMAHEIGHNFGMHHDNESCSCPKGDCVMAAAIGQPTMHWSSCSRQLIQDYTSDARYKCLRNRPSRCGNMVVDPEEECDCGLPNYCRNHCCDPHTCKFSRRSPKVQCADGGCCNLVTCQLELPGVECRSAENECDLPEYCLGDGPTCPPDLHKFNGITCQSRKVCVDKCCTTYLPGGPVLCPANCTNGGFCNNLGKCHCPDGFRPPSCQHYGMGGSEDGGPSVDPKVRRLFQLELYVVFLAIVPIAGFLFFAFYFFLNDEQKESFWVCVRHRFGRGGNKGSGIRLFHPVPLIQSVSIEKPIDELREKRHFSDWVKNRVGLTLPSINFLSANGPSSTILSPASACSTATVTLSALNTPDVALSTPNAFLAVTPSLDDKKQLTPPVPRIMRPAPPPPPKQTASADDSAKSVKSKFPLPVPSSSAKTPFL
ncbi:disintegrin and metalloproteinase domain-containing protein 12-like [Daphnia carinata]|uniref:disintegrin and metalloproteinase domain-containing protein 12-like n=1 Tax=Daphnia carinata TaxID=120202 RepID=UPI00257D5043|nr:disintegrin and metalloproteinase domain-containing protein 12-like [Daphnia carinata]